MQNFVYLCNPEVQLLQQLCECSLQIIATNSRLIGQSSELDSQSYDEVQPTNKLTVQQGASSHSYYFKFNQIFKDSMLANYKLFSDCGEKLLKLHKTQVEMYKESRFTINVPSNSPAYNILFGPWLRYSYTSKRRHALYQVMIMKMQVSQTEPY